jgi:hypothetical protein
MRRFAIASLGLALVYAPARAQDEPAANPEVKLESGKPDYSKCCASLRFDEELGLTMPSLGSLGMRIEQCRHDSDPIRLASLANELKIAEEVAGKKAKVTGEDVEAEAVTLGLHRARPAELKMLRLMVKDDACKRRLADLLPDAEEHEEAVKLQTASGAKAMGIEGCAIISNEGHEVLDIYINGVHRGHLHAHEWGRYFVGDPCFSETLLVARNQFGGTYHQHVPQPIHSDWTWVIHGPH